jgi:hypothetical protein
LSLLTTRGYEALEDFLVPELDYDMYVETFTKHLAEILQKSIEEDEAQELAQQCARSEGLQPSYGRVVLSRRRRAGDPDGLIL